MERTKGSNCIVIPSATGINDRCIEMEVPSTGKILLMLLISVIIYLAVAYAIYWFMNQFNPGMKFNYWWILLILIVAGIISGLITSFFVGLKYKKDRSG